METLDTICEKLRLHELEKITFIKSLADKIGIRAGYLGLAVLSFFSIFIVIEFGSAFLYYTLCVAYPIYMTFKSVEDTDTEKQNHWLSYWVIFSVLLATDRVVSVFLSIIPMYGLIKVAIHIWMFSEKWKGAYYIYQKALHPIFKKYESELDKKIRLIKETAVKRLDSTLSTEPAEEKEKEKEKAKPDELKVKREDSKEVKTKKTTETSSPTKTDASTSKISGHQKKPSTGDRFAELSKPKRVDSGSSSGISPTKKTK